VLKAKGTIRRFFCRLTFFKRKNARKILYLFFIYVIIPKKNAELFGLVNRFTEKKMSGITKRALENSLKSLLLEKPF